MRATAAAWRASQALANPDAARIVEEAAKRATASELRKRPRGLRKYSDLIVVGIASLVAASSLKNRYEHDEYKELAEARLTRLQSERDEAYQTLTAVRTALMESASEGLLAVDSVRSRGQPGFEKRVQTLQVWIAGRISDVMKDERLTNEEAKDRKPDMI